MSANKDIYAQNLQTFVCNKGFSFGRDQEGLYIQNKDVKFIGTNMLEMMERFKNGYSEAEFLNHVLKNREKRYFLSNL